MRINKRGIIYGGAAIVLTGFILFIVIMQNNFNEAPEALKQDAEKQRSLEDHKVSEIHKE